MRTGWWKAVKPGWWLAMTVAAGLIVGIAWPPPPISRAQQARDSAWTLPAAESLKRVPTEAVTEVGQGLRWSGEAAADPTAEGPWKLVGIIRGPAPAALVQLAAGKIEQYAEGSTLPDGSVVTRIGDDEATIEREGCARLHRLHHPPPAETGDCIAKQ